MKHVPSIWLHIRCATVAVISLLLVALPAFAASNYLGGQSGNILTPDGVTMPIDTWALSYHQIVNFIDGDNYSATGIAFGVTSDLELGASFISNGDSDVAVNAKFRAVGETATRPAVLIGVYDLAGSAQGINGDPGFFLVFSKNITTTASEVVGEPSKPLRLTAGFGSGAYNGLLLGLDWTLGPRTSLMAEYTGGRVGGEDKLFSAGIRYAISDTVRLDAAAIDFKNFGLGADLRFSF